MSAIVPTLPGLCGCGEYGSAPHACEFRPGPRRLRVCECGEWTYASECSPCRRPEVPPMPATAIRTYPCGHRVEDGCGCGPWSPPEDNRPGYAWRDGNRIRVPVLRSGGATRGRPQ